MERYSFTIPGNPKGQGRPRFRVIRGKFAQPYDPAQSRDLKATIHIEAAAKGIKPIDGPVSLTVRCYLARPQRLCRKHDPQGVLLATCKPDVDNLYKLIADALTGVAYADDAQVASGSCQKFYHEVGGMPRTDIILGDFE